VVARKASANKHFLIRRGHRRIWKCTFLIRRCLPNSPRSSANKEIRLPNSPRASQKRTARFSGGASTHSLKNQAVPFLQTGSRFAAALGELGTSIPLFADDFGELGSGISLFADDLGELRRHRRIRNEHSLIRRWYRRAVLKANASIFKAARAVRFRVGSVFQAVRARAAAKLERSLSRRYHRAFPYLPMTSAN
jgi:hypothetical protein